TGDIVPHKIFFPAPEYKPRSLFHSSGSGAAAHHLKLLYWTPSWQARSDTRIPVPETALPEEQPPDRSATIEHRSDSVSTGDPIWQYHIRTEAFLLPVLPHLHDFYERCSRAAPVTLRSAVVADSFPFQQEEGKNQC